MQPKTMQKDAAYAIKYGPMSANSKFFPIVVFCIVSCSTFGVDQKNLENSYDTSNLIKKLLKSTGFKILNDVQKTMAHDVTKKIANCTMLFSAIDHDRRADGV